jgi:hypothetical protein
MPSEGGLGFALRALSHRNYRLFFAGQSVSLIGTWLTRIATSWLVYRLSGSAAMLGLIGFCGLVPTATRATASSWSPRCSPCCSRSRWRRWR